MWVGCAGIEEKALRRTNWVERNLSGEVDTMKETA